MMQHDPRHTGDRSGNQIFDGGRCGADRRNRATIAAHPGEPEGVHHLEWSERQGRLLGFGFSLTLTFCCGPEMIYSPEGFCFWRVENCGAHRAFIVSQVFLTTVGRDNPNPRIPSNAGKIRCHRSSAVWHGTNPS